MGPWLNVEDLKIVLLLSIPLVVGGVLHMIVVKKDVLSYLKKPIHPRWFGHNKTWRGFFVMPLLTWPGVLLGQGLEGFVDLSRPLLTSVPSWQLALVLGLGYCLAELPNSFMKRRLGIKEGQTSENLKWVFVIIDQADSAIGCLIAYALLISIPAKIFLGTIVFGTALHLAINMTLFKLNLRKNPF
jgi:CDP-diglyceride synthetase